MWRHSIGLPPLVDAAEFQACAEGAIAALEGEGHEFGQYLEFGVSRGTSLAAMRRATGAMGHGDMALVGFDSFKGLPPEVLGQGWKHGKFRSPSPPRADSLVKGWFADTLTPQTAQAKGVTRGPVLS